jgi:hypothetical protein
MPYGDDDPRLIATQQAVADAVAGGETITVTDNHGHEYTARALQCADRYGLCAIWEHAEPGVTVDGTGTTWFAQTIAEGEGGEVYIDAGQGWKFTADSSAALRELAAAAIA